jgi:hypothetical protein
MFRFREPQLIVGKNILVFGAKIHRSFAMGRGTVMLRLKLCITLVVLLAISASAAAPKKRAAAKPKPAQKTATEPTQPPPPPPTPEQMPAVQPRVSFQNGLLSIEANNSTMYDVLNAVKRQTGANIDVPLGSAADRVVTRIGPGKPRDVMASLLSGTKFNYIIVGPPQNPDGIQRVILSRRPAGGVPAASGQASFNPQVAPAPEDEPVEEMEPEPPPEEIAQPEPPPATLQPGQDPNQQQGQQQNPNQTKTPEQLLQELQRMQQQQQQQQQQQGDSNQQPQQQFPPDRNPEE